MIIREITDLAEFKAWAGGVDTKNIIVKKGLGEDFIDSLIDYFPNGLTETRLNDLLWHESEVAFAMVGLDENGEFPDEDEVEEKYIKFMMSNHL